MSFDSSSENADVKNKQDELDSLLTSVVHYRRPKPDQDLDKENKKIQHLEMIRKFGKKLKNIASTNISAEAASKQITKALVMMGDPFIQHKF